MAFDFPSSPTTGQTYSISGGPTYVYNGTAWVVLTPGNQFNRTVFTATAGQTSFAMNYVVGAIDVYRNGVKLAPADFTATNGTSIVLLNAATVGDTIEVISYPMITYSDSVKRTGDTMTGALTVATSTTHSSVTNAAALFQASQVSTSDAGVLIGSINGNTPYIASSNLNAGAGSATPLTFITSATERMRIDTAGRVTTPYQPAFCATRPGGGGSLTGNIVCTSVVLNNGNHYSTSSGAFTAPVTGIYAFFLDGFVDTNAPAGGGEIRLMKNGSLITRTYTSEPTSYYRPVSLNLITNLAAGDYVQPNVSSGADLHGGACPVFSGFLIG